MARSTLPRFWSTSGAVASKTPSFTAETIRCGHTKTVGFENFGFVTGDRGARQSDELLEESEFEDEPNDESYADDEPEVLRVTDRLAG